MADGPAPTHRLGPAAMAAGPAVSGVVRGTVATFDDPEGYGTVSATDPAGTWFFHCTAIADGSRFIEVGAPVTFEVVPGRLGRFEATDLRPA
jgi:cold shock CspA family protein